MSMNMTLIPRRPSARVYWLIWPAGARIRTRLANIPATASSIYRFPGAHFQLPDAALRDQPLPFDIHRPIHQVGHLMHCRSWWAMTSCRSWLVQGRVHGGMSARTRISRTHGCDAAWRRAASALVRPARRSSSITMARGDRSLQVGRSGKRKPAQRNRTNS